MLTEKDFVWTRRDYIIRFIFIVLFLLGMLWYGYNIWLQHHGISTFLPVEATVIESQLEKVPKRFGGNTVYKPVIKYTYNVGGHVYINDNISMIIWPDLRGQKKRIQDLIIQYPIGKNTTVYYNPHEPQESFFYKSYQFHPYGGFLITMILFFFAVTVGLEEFDKYRFLKLLSVCISWLLIGFLICGHYIYFNEDPFKVKSLIFMILYFILGFGLLMLLLYLKFFRKKETVEAV